MDKANETLPLRSGSRPPRAGCTFLSILACALGACGWAAEPEVHPGEMKLTREAIYPVKRRWASPSGGQEVALNPPPLLWPKAAGKDIRYDMRLAQDPTFPKDQTILSTGQPWALFNPHRKLAPGTWYWQYRVSGAGAPAWSKPAVFRITDTARTFETPTALEMLSGCPQSHPRLLVRADELEAFRKRVQSQEAALAIVKAATERLGEPLPTEQDGVPKQKGETPAQVDRFASDASRDLGRRVFDTAATLCQAYLITGDERFGRAAARQALRVAEWDRAGVSGRNNFGDMYCMKAMALVYDSCYGLLAEADRERLRKGIQSRAGYFYKRWVNVLEIWSTRPHVWQHILYGVVQAAVATLGELPEAGQWLTYAYEVWLARTPVEGTDDGGFAVGTFYNGFGAESLVGIPAVFQRLTSVNYFTMPFYRNNLYYLIYAQPPDSYSDGFGDAEVGPRGPGVDHVRYVQALAARLGDRYASWYVRKSLEGMARKGLKPEPTWDDLSPEGERPGPAWNGRFDLPQARAFRQTGVVAMHTDLEHPPRDLFVGFRSSPWGSFAHAQADQNTFNVLVGSERLFYTSGYKIFNEDDHMLGWYKHTRGHNGVLIDGQGQSYGPAAYGWIPRYLHGERITYCVGDASRAYDAKPAPMRELAEVQSARAQALIPSGKAGLTRFRRHLVLLRPDTVVVYDDLTADHAAAWTWLLHSIEEIRVEPEQQRLFASAAGARGRVDLFASVPLKVEVTNRFSVPFVNWRGKGGDHPDQWHFSAVPARKAAAMRFCAVMQIRRARDPGAFTEVLPDKDGWVQAGGWQIRAELDASRTPALEIRAADGRAGLVTGKASLTLGSGRYDGKLPGSALLVEDVGGRWVVQEAVDELPPAPR